VPHITSINSLPIPAKVVATGFPLVPKLLLACFRKSKQHAYQELPGPVEIAPNGIGVTAEPEALQILHHKSPMPLIGDYFTVRLSPESPLRAYLARYIGPVNARPERNAKNIDRTRNLKRPAIVLGHSLDIGTQIQVILVDLCDVQRNRNCIETNFIAWIGLQPADAIDSPQARVADEGPTYVWAQHIPKSQK
jgi:hypothetical protein